jgi:hypothetical protein
VNTIKCELLVSIPLLFAISQVAMASSSDSGTLTVGHASSACLHGGTANHYGYDSGIGSYDPTGLTGGDTVAALQDDFGCANTEDSFLLVSGFASNPGSQWLISVTCNGVEMTEGSATLFQYSSGQAEWVWAGQFGFKNISQTTCTIVHN